MDAIEVKALLTARRTENPRSDAYLPSRAFIIIGTLVCAFLGVAVGATTGSSLVHARLGDGQPSTVRGGPRKTQPPPARRTVRATLPRTRSRPSASSSRNLTPTSPLASSSPATTSRPVPPTGAPSSWSLPRYPPRSRIKPSPSSARPSTTSPTSSPVDPRAVSSPSPSPSVTRRNLPRTNPRSATYAPSPLEAARTTIVSPANSPPSPPAPPPPCPRPFDPKTGPNTTVE